MTDNEIREHVYLIERGVRALAVVGNAEADSDEMLRISTRLESLAGLGVVAFVIDRGDGTADFGYACSGWVLDLYRWSVSEPAIPSDHRSQIIGLMLGYSAEAIRRFTEENSGRLFLSPNVSSVSTSN